MGRDLIHQGQSDRAAYILASGWVSSYKILNDGSRQIVDFQIPGDFLGLRSVLLQTSDHGIEPVTDIEVSEVLAADLLDAFSKNLRLATAILWAASRDEAMVVEHLVGMGDQTGYLCPLTQYHLADALGLSAVHVNRVLRQLREIGMATFRDGRVTFNDYDRLVDFAEFDSTYLDHNNPLLK